MFWALEFNIEVDILSFFGRKVINFVSFIPVFYLLAEHFNA